MLQTFLQKNFSNTFQKKLSKYFVYKNIIHTFVPNLNDI